MLLVITASLRAALTTCLCVLNLQSWLVDVLCSFNFYVKCLHHSWAFLSWTLGLCLQRLVFCCCGPAPSFLLFSLVERDKHVVRNASCCSFTTNNMSKPPRTENWTQNYHTAQQVPLLVIYPKELKAGTQTGICIPTFAAALFTIARRWKQSRSQSTIGWTDKQNVLCTSSGILFSLKKT